MSTLLSIVIPTRNRAATCRLAVAAILEFPDMFELVVFDTSTNDGWLVELPRDSRLRIERGAETLNIVQCFEAAVSVASGEFVCAIGDDDGVTPALFRWASEAKVHGYDSVTSEESSYVLYNWPDIRSKYFGDAPAGKLYVGASRPGRARLIDVATQRKNMVATGMQGCGSLPRIYHGLVSRASLLTILSRFGCRFTGVSPDVSFSYFASLVIGKHLVVEEPLTISGSSAVSNAGRSAMRAHYGDLWSDPHMAHFRSEPWPSTVPEFFSVETVWAQAGVRAIQVAGRISSDAFPYGRLCARLFLRYPERRDAILTSWRASEEQSGVSLPFALIQRGGLLFAAAVADALGIARRLLRKAGADRRVSVIPEASLLTASDTVRRMMGEGI